MLAVAQQPRPLGVELGLLVELQERRLLQDVHPEVARAERLRQLPDASGVQRLDPAKTHEEPINQARPACCFCAPIARQPDSGAIEMSARATVSDSRTVLGWKPCRLPCWQPCACGFRPAAPGDAVAGGELAVGFPSAVPCDADGGELANRAGVFAAKACFIGVSGPVVIAESGGGPPGQA